MATDMNCSYFIHFLSFSLSQRKRGKKNVLLNNVQKFTFTFLHWASEALVLCEIPFFFPFETKELSQFRLGHNFHGEIDEIGCKKSIKTNSKWPFRIPKPSFHKLQLNGNRWHYSFVSYLSEWVKSEITVWVCVCVCLCLCCSSRYFSVVLLILASLSQFRLL